ncbi:MAG: hypothetical protein ACLVMC_20145, partial [[Clostridium] symbiosum]
RMLEVCFSAHPNIQYRTQKNVVIPMKEIAAFFSLLQIPSDCKKNRFMSVKSACIFSAGAFRYQILHAGHSPPLVLRFQPKRK